MLKYHIQTVEVGSSGASDITFNNIPQTYDDLIVVTSVRNTRSSAGAEQVIYFNGNTSNFTTRYLAAEAGTAVSGTISGRGFCGSENGATSTAGTFNNTEIRIPSYTLTGTKSFSSDSVNENNSTTAYQYMVAGVWSGTEPITSIKLQSGFSYVQYCSASLYGIKRGVDGKTEVASGGTITTSGGYTYHTFTASSTFVANRNLSVEALIVAGGGGGGLTRAGGGAGGYVAQSLAVSPGSYLIALGAGGGISASGSASSAFSISANGGGTEGSSGGSGGGQAFGGPQGLGTAGQGNNGGLASESSGKSAGGGGGGAGAVGQNASGSGTVAGNGGNGSQWVNGTFYAAGGGGAVYTNSGGTKSGGTGGTGGGGQGAYYGENGGSQRDSSAGTANTGSGGGGNAAGYRTNYGTGGSGIVIIRYLTPA